MAKIYGIRNAADVGQFCIRKGCILGIDKKKHEYNRYDWSRWMETRQGDLDLEMGRQGDGEIGRQGENAGNAVSSLWDLQELQYRFACRIVRPSVWRTCRSERAKMEFLPKANSQWLSATKRG